MLIDEIIDFCDNMYNSNPAIEDKCVCAVVLSISLDTFYSNKNYAARKI